MLQREVTIGLARHRSVVRYLIALRQGSRCYCSFVYSALACLRIGTSGSAAFQTFQVRSQEEASNAARREGE